MLSTWLATLILAQAPGPVATEAIPCDPATLRAMSRVEVRVTEGEKAVTYAGVPLAALLDRRAKDTRSMAGVRALSDAVLLARGSDGYQAAVSAAAVAMDPKGERYLLAIERDGKPIDAPYGPVRLIVAGDPRHARWVRDVTNLRLVRLDGLK